MAYSFNWNPEDKMTDEQILSYVKDLAIDYTDNRFHVGFASDDGGRHICVYVEQEPDEEDVWNDAFCSADHKGWRILRVSVPVGYIEAFFSDKSKS